MLPLGTPKRTLLAAALLALLLITYSIPASALLLDARRIAMGGVLAPEPGRLVVENPAYSVVPGRNLPWEGAIPLPLGLITLLDSPQELNPNDPAFDPIRLANVVVNPPLHLELIRPTPLNGDITIDLGQEHMRVYWEDAHLFLPKEPLNLGGRLERFSLGYGRPLGETGRWRLSAAPYLDGAAVTELDDAFYGLLAEGDSLMPDSRYELTGDLNGAAGVSVKALFARSFGDGDGPRFFLAAAPKLIGGIGMIVADINVSAASGDSLFASEGMDVEQVTHTRVNESLGTGFALDLGVVMRHGSWDLGVGVRDLAGGIAFSRTRLERQRLVEGGEGEDSDVVTELLAEGESYTYSLDPFWTFNAGYTDGPLLLLGEVRLRPWQQTLHLGGEYRLSKWAFRGGLRRDAREAWQVSMGVGRLIGGVTLDLALETHNRYIQDERGLALGLSISL